MKDLDSLIDSVYLEAQLEAVGMNAEIEAMELGAWLDKWVNGKIHLFLCGMTPRPDPDDYYGAKWHSSSCPAGYSNPEYDRLVEAGRTTLDLNERKKIYEKLHQVMMDDVPWLPLDIRVETIGKRSSVEGLDMDWSAGYVRGYNVWLNE